jgi:hypothetical protein
MTTFSTRAPQHLRVVDRALGRDVRLVLRDRFLTPRRRAELAVDLIRAHVARTAPVVNAADAESKKVTEHAEAV